MLTVWWWLIVAFIIGPSCYYAQQQQKPMFPECSPNDNVIIWRPRITVITHYSVLTAFVHTPEQSMRDAAAILGVDIDWYRHYTNTTNNMANDIRTAVQRGVDGLIVTIPNDMVFEAVQYAHEKNIPIIVFNTGLAYARQLGLTRVLQSDNEAGKMLASELVSKNYTRPLAVLISSSSAIELDTNIVLGRMNGMRNVLGTPPELMVINSRNDTGLAIQQITERFQAGDFDSIVSLGGAPNTDAVAGAILGIRALHTSRRVGFGFFDAGTSNMSKIMASDCDAWGISQLPYVQSIIPIFLLYLQHVTRYSPYMNMTVPTGPILVTKENYNDFVAEAEFGILTSKNYFAKIGAVIPDIYGDTYQFSTIAGIYELANRLNWTVSASPEVNGGFNNVSAFLGHLQSQIDANADGIILQSSDPAIINYAQNLSHNMSLPVTMLGDFFEVLLNTSRADRFTSDVNAIAVDLDHLAMNVAQTLVANNSVAPVCFGTHTNSKNGPFCDLLYRWYQRTVPNTSMVPNKDMFVHSLDLTTETTMRVDFQIVTSSLHEHDYNPDVYVTISEYLFDVIDYRKLKGLMNNDTIVYSTDVTIDQIHAVLDGRMNRAWHLNSYALGYLSLLDILLSRFSKYRPWRSALVAAPAVDVVCAPGSYYVEISQTAYCYHQPSAIIVPSIQCIPCAPDTFNPLPNHPTCRACPVGSFSYAGAHSCISCDDDDGGANSTQCIVYAQEKSQHRKKQYMAIFLPIGLIFLLIFLSVCFWYSYRQYKRMQEDKAVDTMWLLSYEKLMRPSMQHLSSQPSPSAVSPAAIPLLAGHDNDPEYPVTPITGDNNSTTSSSKNATSADATTVCFPGSATTSRKASSQQQQEEEQIEMEELLSSGPQLHHLSNATIDDYFSTVPIAKASSILYYPGKEPNKELKQSIGFHRNLPVFVKQIGFRRLHVDSTVQHEISLMKVARHPKLVEFIGLCIEPQGTFIVEEYCSKGTLYDALNNPDIALTWIFRFSLINDLLDGLDFLQRSKFMYHGCLNSKCCFITGRWELKITDYDLTRVRQSQYNPIIMNALGKKYPQIDKEFQEQQQKTTAGSDSNSVFLTNPISANRTQPAIRIVANEEKLLWLSPESVIRTDFGIWITYPGKRVDVYSAGIIINEIVSRSRPFQRDVEMTNMAYDKVFEMIQNGEVLPEFASPETDEYTRKINEVIRQCLRREPNLRPSVTMLKNRIKMIDPHLTGSDNVVDNLAILLEQYANDMENLVRQRTANLQQRTLELEEERARTQTLMEDLKHAKEAAEAAAASKQNFLANMSHEIRTPMNAVIGMSRILMESNLSPDLYDCAETIESSGNHLMAIIDDILDYSKIDSGKLNLEHCRMNLTYVVESALKLVSPNFADKGITLWCVIEPNVETGVYGDVVRLRQVLLNLLSNALKFTPEGHVVVRMWRQTALTTPKEYWREGRDRKTSYDGGAPSKRAETILISVQDTGVGIHADKSDKLFQTFSQVDASTTRNFGGTGLGLAISRRLCRMMGGDLWFESEFGKGSTFFCRVVLQMQSPSQTYAAQNHFDQLVKLCSFTYVISDQKDVRYGLKTLLESAMIPRVEAASFQEAKQYLSKQDDSSSDMNATRPSVIIISEDFVVIDSISPNPTTSQAVLDALRAHAQSIAATPALLIRDTWNLRRERNDSGAAASHLVLPTTISARIPVSPVTEEKDPFEQQQQQQQQDAATVAPQGRVAVITKPIKNSKLFSTLIDLLKSPEQPVPNVTTAVRQPRPPSPARSDIHSDEPSSPMQGGRPRRDTTSTRSSISSVVPPLAEIVSNSHALLVDDNPVNQKVMTRMLSRMGIRPQVAQNGKEACDKIEASRNEGNPIDLVFMDVWMPEMNGYEAAQQIRSNLADSPIHPYIIAMTACVMPGDREKCIAAGMNGYVSKPVRKDDLEASIHTYTQVVMRGKESGTSDSCSDEHNSDTLHSASQYSNDTDVDDSQTHPLVPSVTITTDDTHHRDKD